MRFHVLLLLSWTVALVPAVRAQTGPIAVALKNPGFEEGFNGWDKKVDPLDPNALAIDTTVCHSGKASLRIRQSNGAAYTNVCQMWPSTPYTNYVFSGWIRAAGVVRNGIGINYFVGDVRGHGVGDPIAAKLHEGTYDWTRVVIAFNSGPREIISIFPYLHEATGTVWFDDVSVTVAGAWQGPAAPPASRPLPPELSPQAEYDYDTISTEVASPHWAFGRPLPAPLKLAVLAPVWSQRESVELAQRLDCTVTPIMTHTAGSLGATGFAYGSLALDDAARMVREKLGRKYDALLIGQQKWASLPADAQETILRQVREGMGLVYVQPPGADVAGELGLEPVPMVEDALVGVPLAALPAFSRQAAAALGDVVAGHRLGRGSVVVLRYPQPPSGHHYLTPPTFRYEGGFRHYDYYQSLLAKAVLWAAGRRGEPHLTSLSAPERVARGEAARLVCRLSSTATAALQLRARLRRAGMPYADGTEVVGGDVSGDQMQVSLPTDLPGGGYYCDVRLTSGGKVLDWGSAFVHIESPVTIARLELPSEPSPRPVLRGTVVLQPAPLRGSRVRLSARDAAGRLVAETSVPASGTSVRFALECALSRSVFNELTAEVVGAEGSAVAVSRTSFLITPRHDYRDFGFVVWGHAGDDYLAALAREQIHRYGGTACDLSIGPWEARPLTAEERQGVTADLEEVARAGLSPVPYICRLWPEKEEPGQTVRKPCLTDPPWREALTAALQERAELCRPYAPPGYTLGDENYLGVNNEFCTSPSCLQGLRTYLRAQYATVERLNEAWGTSYASFDEAQPTLQREARTPRDYPRWVDWRLYMNSVFAGAHGLAAAAIASREAAPRVGFDGAYGDSQRIGYDWGALGRVMRLWNVYIYSDPSVQIEGMRSFGSADGLRGCWYGGYTYQRLRPAFSAWSPWYQVFHGCNSAWFYAPYTRVGGSGEVGLRPDLRPYDCLARSAAEVRRLQAGVGRLLLSARRDNCGLALVYSPPSQMVTALDSDRGDHLANLQTMAAVLEDAGLQYDLLPADRLAEAKALAGYRAVLLPTVVALDEAAAGPLRRFAAAGGLVLADWGPGVYDQHGKLRDGGSISALFGVKRGGSAGVVHLEHDLPGVLPVVKTDADVQPVTAQAQREVDGHPLILDNRVGRGRAVLLNLDLGGYRSLRGPQGAGVQELLARFLAGAGASDPVALRGQWGAPERVECVRWQLGANRIIGLLKSPDTPGDGEDLRLQAGGQHWVYDLLAGKELGRVRSVRLHLGPGEVALYALSPAPVEGVRGWAEPGAARGLRQIRFRVETADAGPRVVSIQVQDPSGQPYPAGATVLNLAGTAGSCTIPIDLEAPAGDWQVTVTDVLSGQTGQVALPVRDRSS